jgi:hypothetical protein
MKHQPKEKNTEKGFFKFVLELDFGSRKSETNIESFEQFNDESFITREVLLKGKVQYS